MLNFIECGCAYEIDRESYPITYYKDSLQRFSECKSCRKNEKNLTDKEVEVKVSKIIESLWNELNDSREDGKWNEEYWCVAQHNYGLIFNR